MPEGPKNNHHDGQLSMGELNKKDFAPLKKKIILKNFSW